MDNGAAPAREVFVVDDDREIREILLFALGLDDFSPSGFSDGDAFLAEARRRTPACVLLDVHMPGRSGLEVLRELNVMRYGAPILIVSGQADIPLAVEAVKQGAFDVIEKPFQPDAVVARVKAAIEAWHLVPALVPGLTDHAFPGRSLLTPREREVLAQIAAGYSNKQAGRTLGISPRTVEVHRARIMDKLHARNAADLMRIVLTDAARS